MLHRENEEKPNTWRSLASYEAKLWYKSNFASAPFVVPQIDRSVIRPISNTNEVTNKSNTIAHIHYSNKYDIINVLLCFQPDRSYIFCKIFIVPTHTFPLAQIFQMQALLKYKNETARGIAYHFQSKTFQRRLKPEAAAQWYFFFFFFSRSRALKKRAR